jgi:hypothetical protein
VRREKAAERREKAMTFPELARQRVEADPERWLEPYEKARADGDWRAPEALMDRIYGRPAQASASQHFEEIEAGDVVEIRRLLLEAITVERPEPGESADDLLGEP